MTRYAIRVDADTLLTCPEVPRSLPRAVRVRVFEYILRRQPALAFQVLEGAAGDDAVEARAARLAVLMAQTPHKNARGYGLVA